MDSSQADECKRFRDYDWDADDEFQRGLQVILQTAPHEESSELSEQARFYYYSRQTAYRAWSEGRTTTETSDTSPSYPASFAEIVELIQLGKPVPGIRQIPSTLNTEEPSASRRTPIRKPWQACK